MKIDKSVLKEMSQKNAEALLEASDKIQNDVSVKLGDYRKNRIDFLKYRNEYKYRLFESCLEIGKVLLPILVAGLSIQQAILFIDIKIFVISIVIILSILMLIALLMVSSINKSNSEYSEHIETSLEEIEEDLEKSKLIMAKAMDLLDE